MRVWNPSIPVFITNRCEEERFFLLPKPKNRAVILAAAKTDGAVEIRFDGLLGVAEPIDFSDAGENVPALLVPIGARYVAAPDGSALVLQLPEKGVSYGRTR